MNAWASDAAAVATVSLTCPHCLPLPAANPLGILVTQVASPLLVQKKEQIPTLNYVFGGLAVLCELVTLVCITRQVRELGMAWSASLPWEDGPRLCRERLPPAG